MKKVLIFIVYISTPLLILAQNTVGGIQGKGMDMNARPGGIVQEIKLDEPKLIGNTYLNDQWNNGVIYLTGGHKIENYPIKYDIKNHVLEIKIEEENKVKALQGLRVEKFVWYNSQLAKEEVFINSSSIDPSLTNSFITILSSGQKAELITRFKVKLIKGNYVQALDMGERNSKIVKEKEYYFRINGKLIEVPTRKKQLQSIFPDSYGKINNYIKKNHLRLKVESELINITEFINSI